MAESAYLLIAGNGKTSSLNVEALLNDYIILLKQRKQRPVITLVCDSYPSEGQQYAVNIAKEKEIELIAYVTEDSKAAGLPGGTSFTVTDAPYKEASKLFKDDSKAYGLLLWDDEDPRCLDALASFSAKGIPCYDLTNGLIDITPVVGIKPKKAPTMPLTEVNVEPHSDEEEGLVEELEEEEEDLSEELEEYTEEEEVLMETLYDAMNGFAKIMARMIITEMKKSE
jgi:hypothetical protein